MYFSKLTAIFMSNNLSAHLALFCNGIALRVVLLCLACLSFTIKAQTVEVLTEYLPPFQQQNDDGSLGGYATEVIHRLFEITQDKADIKVIPWARAYDRALNEKNILIYSISHTKKRHELFHWVGSLRYEQFHFWGLKTNFSQPISELPLLKNISVAATNEHNSEQYLTDHGFSNVYRVVNNNQPIQMLYNHRVNMILGNSLIIKSQAIDLGFQESLLMPIASAPQLDNSLDIAFSKTSDIALVKRFQEAFKQLKESGELAEIKAKWQIFDDGTF